MHFRASVVLCLFFLLCVVSSGQAQGLVIPQVADGGGWLTTIVLTNTSTNAAAVSLAFFRETTGGVTQPWNLTFAEAVGASVNVPAASTMFLHSTGTSNTTSVGWGQLQGPAAIAAYAIFTEKTPGQPDQEGTAPAIAGASRLLLPFDNAAGYSTAIAVVNPTSSSETVSVSVQTDSGAVTGLSLGTIPAQGHLAFFLPQQFSGTNGQRGLMEFMTTGSLSMIGLRFNPTGPFTAAPVYSQTGAPIIGGTTGGTTTLPSFSTLTITQDLSTIETNPMTITSILVEAVGGSYILTCYASFHTPSIAVVGVPSTSVDAATALSGNTLTFNTASAGSSIVHSNGQTLGITSFQLTLTLTPSATDSTLLTGSVTGSLNVADASGPLSGTFSGFYVMTSSF